MHRYTKITLSIVMGIAGWLLTGWGFTTKLGHPVSSIAFLSGVVFMIGGVIFFVVIVNGDN